MARSFWQRLVEGINDEYERRILAASDLHPLNDPSEHPPLSPESVVVIHENHRADTPDKAGTVFLANIERGTPHAAASPASPPTPDPADDEDGIAIANIPPGTRR